MIVRSLIFLKAISLPLPPIQWSRARIFYPPFLPQDLAYKAIATNLSDLAAMGAKPAWISLALTLPEVDENWLSQFSQSLFDTLNQYDVTLIGGDTTKVMSAQEKSKRV